MDPTSSAELELSPEERATLLEVARSSIVAGLEHDRRYAPEASAYRPRLQEHKGCFVTLHLNGELRGCVGTLRARGPLVVEVSQAAHSAAFHDPRFPPLEERELAKLDIHISVLSALEPMQFDSEPNLLAQLRPGVDGLVLSDGGRLGTFLPAVWEKFPEPAVFFAHLRTKAGLAPDYWSDTIKVERYSTESFS